MAEENVAKISFILGSADPMVATATDEGSNLMNGFRNELFTEM